MHSADELIALTDRGMNEISAAVREELATYTDDELLAYAKRLMAEPHANLVRLTVTSSRETVAMIAYHYYHEYFRRAQVKAMESKDV